MGKLFGRYRNLVHFFALLFLGVFCLLLTKFHFFANPVPSEIYNAVFYFQFLLVFSGYCISFRLGRILLIVGVLLLSRLPYFAYSNSNFLLIGGFFTGGIWGLTFKIFLSYARVSPFVRSIHDRFTFTRGLENRGLSYSYFPIILFLLILLLNSFIKFFHLPLLTGTDLQDYYFFPESPSRSLYSLTANIILPMIYALVYCYAEERSFYSFNQGAFRDFGEGILYSFAIQSIVIFIQTFISISFLAQGTNNAADLGRVTGLFRDAGSATWMYPILLIYSLHYSVKELNISLPRHIFMLSVVLLIMGGILGYKQGRAYNLILFSSFLLFHMKNYKRYKNNLGFLKSIFFMLSLFLCTAVLFIFFSKISNTGRLWDIIINFNTNRITLSEENKKVLTPEKCENCNESIDKGLGKSGLDQEDSSNLADKILALDPPRQYLNQVAIHIFEKNLFLGGGVGSIPMNIKDPTFPIPNPGGVLDGHGAGSFYMGILADVGILGTLMILVWLFLQIYWRSHLTYVLYLVIPLLFGYHVAHPDGSVFLIIILTSLHRIKFMPQGKSKLFSIGIIICSLIFLIKSISFLLNEKKVPEFRYDNNLFYQISYYQKGKILNKDLVSPDNPVVQGNEISYNTFKGKLIWKLGQTGKLGSCTFLGEETLLSTIRMRWTYLDQDYMERGHEDISISKYDFNSRVHIPANGVYVVIEELDSSDFPINRGTIFSVKSSCFSDKNEFLGEKN